MCMLEVCLSDSVWVAVLSWSLVGMTIGQVTHTVTAHSPKIAKVSRVPEYHSFDHIVTLFLCLLCFCSPCLPVFVWCSVLLCVSYPFVAVCMFDDFFLSGLMLSKIVLRQIVVLSVPVTFVTSLEAAVPVFQFGEHWILSVPCVPSLGGY